MLKTCCSAGLLQTGQLNRGLHAGANMWGGGTRHSTTLKGKSGNTCILHLTIKSDQPRDLSCTMQLHESQECAPSLACSVLGETRKTTCQTRKIHYRKEPGRASGYRKDHPNAVYLPPILKCCSSSSSSLSLLASGLAALGFVMAALSPLATAAPLSAIK